MVFSYQSGLKVAEKFQGNNERVGQAFEVRKDSSHLQELRENVMYSRLAEKPVGRYVSARTMPSASGPHLLEGNPRNLSQKAKPSSTLTLKATSYSQS